MFQRRWDTSLKVVKKGGKKPNVSRKNNRLTPVEKVTGQKMEKGKTFDGKKGRSTGEVEDGPLASHSTEKGQSPR